MKKEGGWLVSRPVNQASTYPSDCVKASNTDTCTDTQNASLSPNTRVRLPPWLQRPLARAQGRNL
jgi:hypothetical protein